MLEIIALLLLLILIELGRIYNILEFFKNLKKNQVKTTKANES